jgi:thiamine-monophosphate kinase
MTKRTEIAEYGEFALIDHLVKDFSTSNASTVKGPGDDAAVIDAGGEYMLLSSDMLLEGVDFDLTYFPLKHLGYKAVVTGIDDILAMNGIPRQITVSLGVSAKISVEQLEELYSGIRAACEEYGTDLAGGDTTASVNGLAIAVSALGTVEKDKISYRGGAQTNDLICITGDLGAAYMGLHLLEREKRAFRGNGNPRPEFGGYEYILRRQLQPYARLDVVKELREAGIVPTSMIDISDGLASDMLQICKSSRCGARIYLERIPIAKETHRMAAELNADPVVAALNGGGDHELLFTVPLSMRDKVARLGGVDIIGHITAESTGAALVTPDGSDILLRAPGFANS